MAGTRTAPLFTAAATDRQITLHLIDASGDFITENIRVPVAETAADIEAYAAGYAAGTNASLYAITDSQIREGASQASAAVAAYRGGVENGINLSFANPTTHVTQGVRLVAPVPACFVDDSDTPDPTSAPIGDLTAAVLGVVPAGAFFDTAQYTSRVERKNNPKVSV